MASPWSGIPLAALAMILAGGCAAESAPSIEPPSPPADWVVVTSGADDLWLALPPWLVPFDTTGAVFANEIVAGGGQGMQLLAEGPGTAEPQPGREGPQRWLEHRVEAPGAGLPAITGLRLPEGEAIRLERTDRAGTPRAWRMAAYAISTPFGVAYLLIDGPPAAWTAHEEDIARIPQFVRAGPGSKTGARVEDAP